MAKVNVFITVDTEHSIGGAFADPGLKPVGNEKRIFGRIGDKEYGVPLIADIAEANNIPLTFFVEVLNNYYFGEGESREVCKYIVNRGHDVQLHLHPNYQNFQLKEPSRLFFSDLMGDYDLKEQIRMLEEGREILIQNGFNNPIAFRAGCFGANHETLKALKNTGFIIDSSYNQSYLGKPCMMKDMKINDLALIDGVAEFPITNFKEKTAILSQRYRPLDINGVSFKEMRYVLENAVIGGPKNLTVLLHSFSFIKPYDVQYRKVRVRRNIVNRFRKLCTFLAEHSDKFQVKTFGSVDKNDLQRDAADSVQTFLEVPAGLSVMRYFEQIRDRL